MWPWCTGYEYKNTFISVQDIFEDLVDPDPTANEDPYAVCIRKLNKHFRTEEKMFHLNATCSVNWRRLKENLWISSLCVFATKLGIVTSVLSLKKKLLETRNITLADVLEKARASEAAGQQMKYMAEGSDVNVIRKEGRREDSRSW